jgi:hypothetical protein
MQNSGYSMKNANGDKVFISILHTANNSPTVPIEFHRLIVPIAGGPFELAKEVDSTIFNNNSNKNSHFFFKKLKKLAIINANTSGKM